MNLIAVRQRLHDLCEEAGSIRAWAEENGLPFSQVAAVRRGDMKPSRKILRKMGLKRAFSPKNKIEMKFEDI